MLKVKVNNARDFSEKRKAKLDKAIALADKVVNSELFKQRILNFRYTYSSGRWWWKKWYTVPAFRWNDGLSNQQVYNLVMSGKEHGSQADSEIDVDITLVMARHNGVLGYTYPDTLRTWIYSWFFDSADLSEIVGNIVHEWCHKVGFDHEYNRTSLRQYTVPYGIGYIAEEIAERI